ncbi:MAG TPA: zinc ribbon domain-containing protein [Thermomicrobiales bacterium]|nr:zinc ribbon domain-containing protein [Thermomicrobiales bacterium]HRA48128.1 zinc ribbon domain-containing protein [Thermomicrobiales bacterium]
MPRYGFRCPECEAEFDLERPMAQASGSATCPVCGTESPRQIASPQFLFKADPRDNRPYWHEHDGYGHSHAPRRGRHAKPEENH